MSGAVYALSSPCCLLPAFCLAASSGTYTALGWEMDTSGIETLGCPKAMGCWTTIGLEVSFHLRPNEPEPETFVPASES
jgi:hypothetical protein